MRPRCSPCPAAAQTTWLQIEAQPNLNTALDRARAYAALFPDVEGYQLGNGWYGIALGPQDKDTAAARLLDLRRQNLIPADSYMSLGDTYGQRFWPVGSRAPSRSRRPSKPPPCPKSPLPPNPKSWPTPDPNPMKPPLRPAPAKPP